MAGAIGSGPPVGTCRAPKAATSCARSCRSPALVHGSTRWRVAWRGGPLACVATPLACCCARCGRFRCSCARVPGHDAVLSLRVANVQVCSGMWQPVERCGVLGAVWCNVVQMWPVWRQACMRDGRTVLARIVPRACSPEQASGWPLEGV